MSSISIRPWRCKVNRPRYYVSDGREPVGVIFYETRGIFTAVDHDGRLVTASTSVQVAANALVPETEASS
jgi:hypothetical protein